MLSLDKENRPGADNTRAIEQLPLTKLTCLRWYGFTPGASYLRMACREGIDTA